jgi:hypothetical protein
MSISSTPRSPSPAAEPWGALVARQVKLQAGIEAALDRADACERLGDFELALDWLDLASTLGGGLSPSCTAQRARCARELERGKP